MNEIQQRRAFEAQLLEQEKDKIYELATSICYDRYSCRELGINYNRINKADYSKAWLHAYKAIIK